MREVLPCNYCVDQGFADTPNVLERAGRFLGITPVCNAGRQSEYLNKTIFVEKGERFQRLTSIEYCPNGLAVDSLKTTISTFDKYESS